MTSLICSTHLHKKKFLLQDISSSICSSTAQLHKVDLGGDNLKIFSNKKQSTKHDKPH